MFIHELADWPHFRWDYKSIVGLLAEAARKQGRLLGQMQTAGLLLRDEALLQTLTQDVLKSSEIEGESLNEKQVRSSEVKKHYVAPNRGHDPLDRYDQGDYLLVRRPVIEWEFFWKSAPRPKNRSYGSVNYVQYRYTPVTVNVGAEFGSVETFEYGNNEPQTINGVPYPFADTRKP